MANAALEDFLLIKEHPTIFHLKDIKTKYTGADNNGVEVAGLTTEKAAVETSINSAFDTLVAAYPAETAALNAQRTIILTSLDTNIPDSVDGEVTTIIQQVITDYAEAITAEGYSVDCPKCKVAGVSQGRYPIDGPGGTSAIQKECNTCFGFTKVTTDIIADITEAIAGSIPGTEETFTS